MLKYHNYTISSEAKKEANLAKSFKLTKMVNKKKLVPTFSILWQKSLQMWFFYPFLIKLGLETTTSP